MSAAASSALWQRSCALALLVTNILNNSSGSNSNNHSNSNNRNDNSDTNNDNNSHDNTKHRIGSCALALANGGASWYLISKNSLDESIVM